ncbi:MAG: alpha/beta fold hydrolase [Pseudomonadota bacterium]
MQRLIMHIPGILLLSVLLSGCTQMFFQPQRQIINSPENYGFEYQVENFQAADGTALSAWFMPAHGQAKATVLYLHGNGENVSTHFRSVLWLTQEGFNVFALDYRGYGTSAGAPSLAGAQLDIDAAMRKLLGRKDVDPQRIVLFGQSLGGALAIYYAAHTAYRANLRAVVIDSAFFDYRQIVREKLAGIFITWPLQWLPWLTVNNEYTPAAAVAAVSPLPLLLLHGDHDKVIPLHHSQELYARAREPKELWIVPGAGHIQAMASVTVRNKLAAYMLHHTSQPDAK